MLVGRFGRQAQIFFPIYSRKCLFYLYFTGVHEFKMSPIMYLLSITLLTRQGMGLGRDVTVFANHITVFGLLNTWYRR